MQSGIHSRCQLLVSVLTSVMRHVFVTIVKCHISQPETFGPFLYIKYLYLFVYVLKRKAGFLWSDFSHAFFPPKYIYMFSWNTPHHPFISIFSALARGDSCRWEATASQQLLAALCAQQILNKRVCTWTWCVLLVSRAWRGGTGAMQLTVLFSFF